MRRQLFPSFTTTTKPLFHPFFDTYSDSTMGLGPAATWAAVAVCLGATVALLALNMSTELGGYGAGTYPTNIHLNTPHMDNDICG